MNQPAEEPAAENAITILYRCGCIYRQWKEAGPEDTRRLNHRCEKHHVTPEWLTQDAGLPRDGRGNVVWETAGSMPIAEQKRERDLPAWVQQRLFYLRQEVWTCQRALQHRNERLSALKRQLRVYQRMFLKSIGVVPKEDAP